MKNIKQIFAVAVIYRVLAYIAAAILWVAVIIGLLIWNTGTKGEYSTTDISDYGKYTGNYDNATVSNFINSFFPEKIEDGFENVVYSYRAKKFDTYAYEAYLEFTVADQQEFFHIVDRYTANYQAQPFPYDPSFCECVIADIFIAEASEYDQTRISISYAEIGKILYSVEEQCIIFVALGVYDGGAATANYLTVYFNRFQIDPLAYTEDSSVVP